MKPLRLAWLNLCRRLIPTAIAVLSIAISVACAGVLLRVNLLSQNRFASIAEGGDAVIGAKAGGIDILLGALNGEGQYPGFLPYKLFETLRAQTQVHFEDGANAQPNFIRSIIPLLYFAKAGPYRVLGTDESFVQRPDGALVVEGRWASGMGEVVAGSAAALKMGWHVGDMIPARVWVGESSPVRAFDLKLVGILAPQNSAWDRELYSGLATAQGVLAGVDLRERSIWGPNVLSYYLVYLKPGGFAALSALVNRRTVGEAIFIPEQNQRLRELTGTGTQLGMFVTILILALGGLSVASMLITRFDAMALQLAVLRAIGYSRASISRWLLWEGFLLGLAACVLGATFDGVGFPLLRAALGEALPPPELVASSLWLSWPIWLTALAATTASVFIPLYRVYRQDVHFSLRS
jgi:putative ABC transport system permease protein